MHGTGQKSVAHSLEGWAAWDDGMMGMIGMDLPSGNLTYGKSPFNDGYTLHLPSGKHTKKPWKITFFYG